MSTALGVFSTNRATMEREEDNGKRQQSLPFMVIRSPYLLSHPRGESSRVVIVDVSTSLSNRTSD